MSNTENMQAIIDLAKHQVEAWYNPGTTRAWTCTVAGNNVSPFSNIPEERTELYILTGGEAKGFVVAFHGLGKVIAHDMFVTRSKEFSIQDVKSLSQTRPITAQSF